MKYPRFVFAALVYSSLALCSLLSHAGEETFSKEQILEDFDVLYRSLTETHYNPYAYITEDALNTQYRHIRTQFSAPAYSQLETITRFQQLVSSINNGHTEVEFPVAAYMRYAESGGTVFPLVLAFEDGLAFIRANYSDTTTITPGTELIAINGEPIGHILAQIYPQISAERHYLKNAKLEVLSFPRYYWYVKGEKDHFTVTLRINNELRVHTISSIPVVDGFEAKKDEVLRAQQEVRFFDDIAYLNPGHFSGDETQYKQFIDNAFETINNQHSATLIIDLRNNAGGDDAFSDYLVAYLADAPFKWNARFRLRTSALLKQDTKQHRDLSDPYWKSIMAHQDGVRYDFEFAPTLPVDSVRRYAGKVYVLINRQTHSQASVTAAQIKDYGWGITVGEETGDYPTLYASQFSYTLPNTGITVRISKGYIVRVSGSEKQHGVLPDIPIRDHLLDSTDEILSGLLSRLKQGER
ncbi:S41 family peptidase [Alteromonas sp. CYL-A6]|uniref:S41 family peptidase n=1 Tax=Alteromonas nitratireducens TaxID=3390813 RepID=UPI0034B4D60E